MKNGKTILEIDDLTVSFQMYKKGLRKENLEVLHSLSLEVGEGEIVAVAGSSGSGKSVLAHAVLGLLSGNAKISGQIRFLGEELDCRKRKRYLGRGISFIPQSVDYLDPLMKAGPQTVGVHSTREKQKVMYERYRLPEKTKEMYPFQLSGGMARRVLISAAVAEEPKLLIADEPTPGLSADIAMDTLKHFRGIADEGAGILLITHDIDLALHVADRIAVFYAGTIVETADARDFQNGGEGLRHPYSKAFLAALPQNGFRPLAGNQPYAGDLPEGCLFAPRCEKATKACFGEIPVREIRGGKVRCIYAT